jgi:hypothetical protein
MNTAGFDVVLICEMEQPQNSDLHRFGRLKMKIAALS